jgi:hypothetical protein
MPGYDYKAIPFIGQIKSGFFSKEGPEVASKQLEQVINTNVNSGWEFVEVSHVNILVQPGCLAGLLGARATSVVFDQVIFRRAK